MSAKHEEEEEEEREKQREKEGERGSRTLQVEEMDVAMTSLRRHVFFCSCTSCVYIPTFYGE